MKKSFRLMNAAIIAAGLCFGLTACDPESEDSTSVITFEDVALGSNGFWNGNDCTGALSTYTSWGSKINAYTGGYSSGILTCNNVFNQSQVLPSSTWWTGMACSSQTNMDSIGFKNQYSVYAHSAAGKSQKFGLIGSDSAFCSFAEPVDVKSLMINNSTYVYWALKEGKDGMGYVRKFAAGDYFYVTITGYNAQKIKTGEVKVYLADFRDSKTYVCEDWTSVSLESLGEVKSLVFNFTSTDGSDWGMNTPAYACIDNIEYKKN